MTETGTTVGKILATTVLSFIDLSGAFVIHAKTCRR